MHNSIQICIKMKDAVSQMGRLHPKISVLKVIIEI